MTITTASMIRNKLPEQKKEKQPQSLCGCYNEHSTDARCCGLCYCFCPAVHIDKEKDEKRCDCCPTDFCEYWYSGYVQTTEGYGNPEEEINGLCCWLCFPVKFSVFFPCCLGSLCNQLINTCCATTCCATLCGYKPCGPMTCAYKPCGGCASPIKRNYLC